MTPTSQTEQELWFREKYQGPYSRIKKRINWLNNKLQHKTDHLPPMWWPVQICFHLLHPRHLALHQELHTQRPCSHLHIRNALGFRNLHKKSWLESSFSIIVQVTVRRFQNFDLIGMNDMKAKCWTAFTVPASSVLVLTDTGLGSPTPTLFLAKTRNSYSTQALRSTTVAVSVLPSIISGTGGKKQ